MNNSHLNHVGYCRKSVSTSVHELHPVVKSLQDRKVSGNVGVDTANLGAGYAECTTASAAFGISKSFLSIRDCNESDSGGILKTLLTRTKSAVDPGAMSGFTAFLRSKRRYYFVLDEINCQLAYYKDYDDFARKRQPVGSIELKNSAVTLNETKPRIFTLHSVGGRQYELEAESEESTLVWLESLQKRSMHKRDVWLEDGCAESGGDGNVTTSLPSEDQLAAALNSALLKCTQPLATKKQSTQATPQNSPPKHCRFYFGSTPCSTAASSATEQPSSPLEENLDRDFSVSTRRTVASQSATSLHFWINQWLCKQEFEMGSKESVTSGSIATAQATRTNSAVDPVDKIVNGLEHYHIAELRKELERYKQSDQSQKKQIGDLTLQIQKLQHQFHQLHESISDEPDGKAKFFQLQNKFLNAEVMRLSTIVKAESEEMAQLTLTMGELQRSLDIFKSNFAFLMQSSLRIFVGDKHSDCAELKLFGFDTHKKHLLHLLLEARKLDPSLPSWDALLSTGSGYVDPFGFRNTFTDTGLALHYAASQLLAFYRSSSDQEKRHKWKEYLQKTKNGLTNTKEARLLTRAGIPARYRSAIWRCLVHQKVSDLKLKHGKYYFRGLCNWQASDHGVQGACAHQKQITLDLMRTMPNNIHFNAPPQKGVVQLQAVLQAICAHNPRIGYCQGMNFVAAICLLFLNPEDSFWFLVALIERYFVPNYFDHSLTGAQADQEVLKDILEEKIPELAKHFIQRDIELATVTLNWFLALFYESLPFETLLRIWDCFLLEGPKVLFRFVLAILYTHRNTLLECTDTMSILKALKLCAKHTYDVDALVKVAFETLKPFPRRQELIRRQSRYMEILKIRLQRKDELKAVAMAASKFDHVLYQIEVAVSILSGNAILLAYCSQDKKRRLALVSSSTGHITDLEPEFEWAIVTATTSTAGDKIFLSLLSGDVISMSVDPVGKTCNIYWQKRLPDVVLQLLCYDDDRLFAAMANGTMAVFENASQQSEPGSLQLYYIPIGAAPLSCLCLIEEETQIWCGIGGRLIILNAKTLDCLERLTIATSSAGCISAIFDRLLTLQVTRFGVWMSAFNSTLIQLWDANKLTCKLIFDTSDDHRSLNARIDSRITCMLAFDACIWVGTADGYILVYDVMPRNSSPRSPRQKRTSVTNDGAFSSPTKPEKVSRAELGHRDSGYSGTNSSHYASSDILQYLATCSNPTAKSPKSSVVRPMHDYRKKKRWRSLHDLAPANLLALDHQEDETRGRRQRQRSSPCTSRKCAMQKSSVTSLATSPGGELEYDDLFVPYPEHDAHGVVFVGGLLSSSKSKSHSDWSLGGVSAAPALSPPFPSKEQRADPALVTEPWTTHASVDGRAKKSRRQLLRRPTRQELKRKDLDLDEYLPMLQSSKKNSGPSMLSPVMTEAETDTESQNGVDASETASVLSMASNVAVEPPYPYRLQCIMRLKISDKPVRCLALSKTIDGKQCTVSCSGGFDESEAILLWTKDANDQKLWIPKPVNCEKNYSASGQMPGKLQLQRRSTSSWFSSS